MYVHMYTLYMNSKYSIVTSKSANVCKMKNKCVQHITYVTKYHAHFQCGRHMHP